MSDSTITMQAPEGTVDPVEAARTVPTGLSYTPDDLGQIEALPQDVATLIGLGFVPMNAPITPLADLLGGIGGEGFTGISVGDGLHLSDDTLNTTPTVREVSGTTDTIVSADAGNAVSYTGAAAVAVTVSADLSAGFTCLLLQRGAGVFTVAGAAGVTVVNRQSQLASAGQYAQCSLFADDTDHFIFGGDTA